MPEECDECKGSGVVPCEAPGCDEGNVACELCDGVGAVDDGEGGADLCPDCRGTGQEECDECKGQGAVECEDCGGTGVLYN